MVGRKGASRKDACWSHCTSVDGNRMHVQCNYCQKRMSGGVHRMKHHFAGTRQNVPPCESCPENLKETYKKSLKKHLEEERGVEIEENHEEEDEEGAENRRKGTMDAFVVRTGGGPNAKKKLKQITMNAIVKSRIPACRKIMRCIYGCGLPLSLVKDPLFKDMIEECAKYGIGLKLPSYYEARVKFLKMEVDDMHVMLEKYKKEWAKTGCTLMSDGWTDGKNRSIINFLVNSPMGTVFLKSIDASGDFKDAEKLFAMLDEVVEEIGEENVVQVITDGASAYVNAGKLLMEKRKKLFWNPCAAHVMDLMLEDIGKLDVFEEVIGKARRVSTFVYNHVWVLNLFRKQKGQRELKRPGVTRFATCFLCLESFERNKVCLKALFGSKQWLESSFAKTEEGMSVMHIITRDDGFWRKIKYCLLATAPLVKVLKLVDGDAKPAMGYIYEAMDRAKEEIRNNFDNKERLYKHIWDIIDERWNLQLHRPLHAAAYFLNPKFFYSEKYNEDDEVQRGVIETIERMYPDSRTRFRIDRQLEKYRNAQDTFGKEMAIHSRDKKQPAHWWGMYGVGKEAKEFAIRVLSLTCSATGCERNWSVFEHIHSKKRSKMEHERLNNIVFIKYNLKLEMRQKERETKGDHYNPIELSDMESDNEWLTGEHQYEGEEGEHSRARVAPVFSWKDVSDCLLEQEIGTSSKKRKRGPRDLRYGKERRTVQGQGIKVREVEEVVEEDEPDLEEDIETDEGDESSLNLDDESDDESVDGHSNDQNDEFLSD